MLNPILKRSMIKIQYRRILTVNLCQTRLNINDIQKVWSCCYTLKLCNFLNGCRSDGAFPMKKGGKYTLRFDSYLLYSLFCEWPTTIDKHAMSDRQPCSLQFWIPMPFSSKNFNLNYRCVWSESKINYPKNSFFFLVCHPAMTFSRT